MRRSRLCLILVAPAISACAQVIGADFNDLVQGTGGSAGTDGTAGTAAGDMLAGASGAGPMGGGGGSAGGAAGSAGNVIKDASADHAGAGGATLLPEAGPDGLAADVATTDHEDGEVADVALTPGSVVINELKGQGGGPDWIELTNPGQKPMVIDGYTVAQAAGTTGPPDVAGFLTFPQGTTLAAGAFLMVVAQQPSIGGPTTSCQTIAATCFTVTWGISMSGERIYLLNADAGKSVSQQVDYPGTVMTGQTYARATNGAFQAAAPTPGQQNGI